MRALLLLTAVVVAGTFAVSASATVRPINAHDRALLARSATYEEQIAEQVAARLTGRKSAVRCGSLGISDPNVLGVTFLGRDYFLMLPAECTYLAWFRESPPRWDPHTCVQSDCAIVPKIAMALAVVAHESYHILGYSNEAQVDCYGMQSIWFVASKLGAPVAEAQALASLYAAQMYPRRRYLSPQYWSPECRDGGRYDLRRSLARWPS